MWEFFETYRIVDCAQLASTLFAGWGLYYSGKSMRQQTNADELSALVKFVEDSRMFERLLHEAKVDTNGFRRAFNDFANYLEVTAFALNRGLYGKHARDFATKKLIQDLAIIQSIEGAPNLMSQGIDAPNTFSDIVLFIESNRAPFNEAKACRMKQIHSQKTSTS